MSTDYDYDFSERIAVLTGSDTAPTGDGRTLLGYAVRWDDVAHITEHGRQYEEMILPGSYRQTAMPKLLYDHGRSPQLGMLPVGKVKVAEDSIGLRVDGRLFKNATAAPIAEAAAAGELGLSLRFVVPEGGDKWERRSQQLPLRLVGAMEVREISLTAFPAYTQSAVIARTGLETAEAARARFNAIRMREILMRETQMRAAGIIKPRMTPQQRDRELRLLGVL